MEQKIITFRDISGSYQKNLFMRTTTKKEYLLKYLLSVSRPLPVRSCGPP